MNFNGAVLVDNSKIYKAIDNFKEAYNENSAKMRNYTSRGTERYNDLSFWQKFWHSNEFGTKCTTYLRAVSKVDSVWDVTAGMVVLGWLTHEEGNFYRNRTSYKTIHNNLLDMIEVGGPVYLNPEQAGFVNKYYRDKEVQE
jgi:hypothetical protein